MISRSGGVSGRARWFETTDSVEKGPIMTEVTLLDPSVDPDMVIAATRKAISFWESIFDTVPTHSLILSMIAMVTGQGMQ